MFAFWKVSYLKLATSEISIFSVAEENVLSLTLSETLKTGFLATRPI